MITRFNDADVNVLASISRCMKDVVDEKHLAADKKFRQLLATYIDAGEIIEPGKFLSSENPVIDTAIKMTNEMSLFLNQDILEQALFTDTKEKLLSIMSNKYTRTTL